ncbi:MAG: YiiX/YebB-like N1pC/P60 family cysteine hydrolase [Chitinophagaceae bacterium]
MIRSFIISGVLLLFISLCSCGRMQTPQAAEKSIADSVLRQLRTGDIVLRAGKDEISHFFTRLNQHDHRFSHCGIVVVSDSGIQVAHITAGGKSNSGDLHYELLSSFVAAAHNTEWTVFRPPLAESQRAAVPRILSRLSAAHIRFDKRFDLASDNELYCSEMVCKVLRSAGVGDSVFHISIAGNGKPYIGTDDLYLNNRCTTICQIIY